MGLDLKWLTLEFSSPTLPTLAPPKEQVTWLLIQAKMDSNRRAVQELSVARARKQWTPNDLTRVLHEDVVQLLNAATQQPPVIGN